MKKLGLFLFLGLWSPWMACADLTPGSQTLNVTGEGLFRNRLYGGLQYTYFTTGAPIVGFGIEMSRIPDQVATGANTLAALAEVRVARSKGRWRPFLFGGIGAHHTQLTIDGYLWESGEYEPRPWPDTGLQDRRTLIDDSDVSWAAVCGMGVDVYITEHFFLGSEFRDTILGPTRYDLTPAGQQAQVDSDVFGQTTHSLSLMLRMGVKWGGA